jgi:hypothetical protein
MYMYTPSYQAKEAGYAGEDAGDENPIELLCKGYILS